MYNFLYLLVILGAPIILTQPHMLNVAPEYRTVKGLHPDGEKHKIFVDIEPVSYCFSCPNAEALNISETTIIYIKCCYNNDYQN